MHVFDGLGRESRCRGDWDTPGAVADREWLLGPDHPDTLGSRGNLANAYQEVGRVAEAIVLHERTLADRERLLGPDHPDTLGSRGNLANAYQDAGRPSRRRW